MQMGFKFIDLFAGIGGFHQAMTQLGGECVFASEIDKHAIKVYENNYGITPQGNIKEIDAEDIPQHDVLCAGFPCQTFSVAGKCAGFDDQTRGTLFFEITRILKHHHPKYIILENVKNLTSHDKGRTWQIIEGNLKELGYQLTEQPLIVSPHHFGTPQLRERVIILGVYQAKEPLTINLGNQLTKDDNSIYEVLDAEVDGYDISEEEKKVLTMWNEFYQGIDLDVIGFPIWFDWLKKEPPEDVSKWRKRVIERNNELYQRNQEFIDAWIEKWDNLEWCGVVQKKFEWQAGNRINTIWEGLIQIRQSGIRVKAPNCFQTLVAMVQIPIIGRYKRRLTPREAARLQDFPEDFKLDDDDKQAYKQLGNAINVKVIKKCAEQIIKSDK
ncbi:MAG: DNA cytosine methyltransferase [Clostridia bacterium]|nr:DNA cytosine methyltransferase [Clostridia bacterium]